MTLLLPVVAALVSLLILPGWSFWFDVTPKVVAALIGASIALMLPWRWPRDRRIQWFWILAGIQALAILAGTVISTHPWLSFYGGTWRRSGLLVEFAVLILAVMTTTNARRDLFLRITVLAALPASIYGIFQYFGIDPWIPSAGYHFGEGQFTIVRPPSTLGHAAYFATYLLYAVFAGAAMARSEANRAWKAAAVAASALAGFTIVLTGTRAALVGLAVGALFLAIRQRPNARWLTGAAATLILLGGFYISPAGARLRARVHWSSEDSLGGSRLLLWRDTLRMARRRWLTGYGRETFAVEFPRYQSIELGSAYPDFYHESPHNIFLDALVSQGVVGLMPLVALVGLGVMVARGPIGGAFIAILVSQQFTAFTVPTELYFYFCLAMLIRDARRLLPDGRGSPRAPTEPRPSGSRVASFAPPDPRDTPRAPTEPRPSGTRVASFALAIPMVGFCLYLGTGDALLATARRALDRGDAAAAARAIDRARKWNASADIYFSRRFLVQPGGEQYALDAAQHAPATAEDRQNALVNLAAFYAAQNDPGGVELSLSQAIAAAPNWFKPHWLLAQVLELEGRKAEAEVQASAAVARDGGKHTEVTQVLERLQTRK
jgi:O-antigen ligase